MQALGGAKNHAVVLPDADLDFAADHITAAAYGSAGQRCMAISAVVAVGAAGDALVDKLRERAATIQVGPGDDDGAEMGPVVTRQAQDRVAAYVESGAAEGADARRRRPRALRGRPRAGVLRGPVPLDQVTPAMKVYQDEVFGPLLVVLRAATLDEALDVVNANPYGNGTAVFTSSGEAARTFQRRVTVGMIGINVPIPVPMAFYSFGGWKDSLFGDRHVHGPDGVGFYTRVKAVTSRWPHVEQIVDAAFNFPSSG